MQFQQKCLRETLLWAYENSPFYRELWAKAGIGRNNLLTTALSQFPLVDKCQLMDAFNDVVTDPHILKSDVEAFIARDFAGGQRYKDAYIAINTSGSSGYVGIFLFTEKFWARLIGTLIARLVRLPLRTLLTRKTRLAFTGETTGHHGGSSLVRSAPSLLFKTLGVSASTPAGEFVSAYNAFQPHILTGYASILAHLGEEQLTGNLHIKPELIISSAEPLTPTRQKLIQSAFGIPVVDFYGATECLGIGADTVGSGTMEILDDIVVLEVIDDAGNPAPPGTLGRVVITVLENTIQPLIRYVLGDEICIEPEQPGASQIPFTHARRVSGRNLERLTFSYPAGTFEVHPMEVVSLFIPGLRHYQVVQTGPQNATVRVVAEGDRQRIEKMVKELVGEFLYKRGLPRDAIRMHVEFVNHISHDPKTGKTPIIIPLKER